MVQTSESLASAAVVTVAPPVTDAATALDLVGWGLAGRFWSVATSRLSFSVNYSPGINFSNHMLICPHCGSGII